MHAAAWMHKFIEYSAMHACKQIYLCWWLMSLPYGWFFHWIFHFLYFLDDTNLETVLFCNFIILSSNVHSVSPTNFDCDNKFADFFLIIYSFGFRTLLQQKWRVNPRLEMSLNLLTRSFQTQLPRAKTLWWRRQMLYIEIGRLLLMLSKR